MNVLVLNSGSSSLRFQLVETDLERIEKDSDRKLASGLIERIGSHSLIRMDAAGQPPVRTDAPLRDHRAAVDAVLRWVVSPDSGIDAVRSVADIEAVGHR